MRPISCVVNCWRPRADRDRLPGIIAFSRLFMIKNTGREKPHGRIRIRHEKTISPEH